MQGNMSGEFFGKLCFQSFLARTSETTPARASALSVESVAIVAIQTLQPRVEVQGMTPLHWAADDGHTACVKVLLAAGAAKVRSWVCSFWGQLGDEKLKTKSTTRCMLCKLLLGQDNGDSNGQGLSFPPDGVDLQMSWGHCESHTCHAESWMLLGLDAGSPCFSRRDGLGAAGLV